jgi:hypothetical protein
VTSSVLQRDVGVFDDLGAARDVGLDRVSQRGTPLCFDGGNRRAELCYASEDLGIAMGGDRVGLLHARRDRLRPVSGGEGRLLGIRRNVTADLDIRLD